MIDWILPLEYDNLSTSDNKYYFKNTKIDFITFFNDNELKSIAIHLFFSNNHKMDSVVDSGIYETLYNVNSRWIISFKDNMIFVFNNSENYNTHELINNQLSDYYGLDFVCDDLYNYLNEYD